MFSDTITQQFVIIITIISLGSSKYTRNCEPCYFIDKACSRQHNIKRFHILYFRKCHISAFHGGTGTTLHKNNDLHLNSNIVRGGWRQMTF